MAMIRFRWTLIAIIIISLLGLGVGTVKAAEFDDDGVITKDEIINDDVFISADSVIVDGTVNGILFAGGNTVTINGTINGDVVSGGGTIIISDSAVITGNVFCGAQSIELNGVVKGSSLCGAYMMTLGENADIERNLFFGGYHLTTQSDSKVKQDLFLGGAQAILDGEVGRDIQLGANGVELNGQVGRDVIAEISAPGETDSNIFARYFTPSGVQQPKLIQSGLHVSKDAQIGGKLTYTSTMEQTNINAQPSGGIVFQTPTPVPASTTTVVDTSRTNTLSAVKKVGDVVRNLMTLLILGALVLWLLPVPFRKSVDMVLAKPLPALGWGLVVLIVGYTSAVLATIVILLVGILFAVLTLGGLSSTIFTGGLSALALIMTAFTLLVSYGGTLVVAFMVGELFIQKVAPNAKNVKIWALLIGVFFYVILRAIPIIGWILWFVITLIGLGAMWLFANSLLQTKKIEPVLSTDTPSDAA